MSDSRFAELNSSQGFERGWNILQLAIEILVGVIVLAGLAGLLGTGPLSTETLTFERIPLRMSYQRIVRRTVSSELELKILEPLASGTLEVELPNKLTDEVDVVSTLPRSASMRAESDGIVYVFQLGASRLGTITFSMKARTPSYIDSIIRVNGVAAPLRQLVLP